MTINGLDQTHANSLLDTDIPSSTLVRLLSAMGSATSAGTKLSGSTDTATTWASAATFTKANSAVLNYTAMPAGTTVGVELYDSSATTRKWSFPLAASKTTSSGDTLSFAIGALSVGFVNTA